MRVVKNSFVQHNLFSEEILAQARNSTVNPAGTMQVHKALEQGSLTLDEKLEQRVVRPAFKHIQLPEKVKKQLDSLEAIESFEVLESLFQDLKIERSRIIAPSIPEKLKDHRLQELQRIAERFIHTFTGELNFVDHPDLIERVEAIFKFFPLNVVVQFEGVTKINLKSEAIEKFVKWFPGDKTAVELQTSTCLEVVPYYSLGGLDGFTDVSVDMRLSSDQACNLNDLKAFEGCEKIKKIVLWCENLKDFNGLEYCLALESISLESLGDMTSLVDISALANCQKLKTLRLSRCTKLQDLRGLGGCLELEELYLGDCEALSDIGALRGCTKLKKIVLPSHNSLSNNISALANCLELEEFYWEYTHNENFNDMSLLGGCKKLKKIILSCYELKSLRGLESCLELKYLSLCSSELEDISALSSCLKLEELYLGFCYALSDIRGLLGCSKLKIFELSCATNLKNLDDLHRCVELESITLRNCITLKDVNGLNKCKGLKEIRLEHCENLTYVDLRLRKLEKFEAWACNLKEVKLRCPSLKDLSLSACEELEEMYLGDCQALSDISALRGCTKLKKIVLHENQKYLLQQLPEDLQKVVEFENY